MLDGFVRPKKLREMLTMAANAALLGLILALGRHGEVDGYTWLVPFLASYTVYMEG
mgnify:CR=1 FL=1